MLQTDINTEYRESCYGRTCIPALSCALYYLGDTLVAKKVSKIGRKFINNLSTEQIHESINLLNNINIKGKVIGQGKKMKKKYNNYQDREDLYHTSEYVILIIMYSQKYNCNRFVSLIDDLVFDPIQSQGMKRMKETFDWLLSNNVWKIVSTYSFQHCAKKREEKINYM